MSARRWQRGRRALAVAGVASALGAGGGGPAAAGGGTTLRFNAASPVTELDPAVSADTMSAELLYATCLKLVNYRDRPGVPGTALVPDGAEAMPAISPDG